MKGNVFVNFFGTLVVFVIVFRCIQNESINLNGIISTAWDTIADTIAATGQDSNYQPPSQSPNQPSNSRPQTRPASQQNQ